MAFVFIFCCQILFLYFFGLFGHLHLGAQITLYSGIALLSYLIFKKKQRRKLNFLNSKDLVHLSLILIIYLIIPTNFRFTGWDEFDHWLSNLKVLYLTKQFYKLDSPINFLHYPPGQQLLQYYYIAFNSWNEKIILFIQNLFIFTGI